MAQDKNSRSATPAVVRNSTVFFKTMQELVNHENLVKKGSKVNFFGNLASTTTIPAQLIKKYKCELVPIYIERKDKYHFKMHISKPIKVNSNKTTEDITLFLNTVLEKMILKNVDQWIWTHNRWKK